MSNQAAVLAEAKAQITSEQRPIPKPGQNDILVKNAALATDPVDWKMQESGYFIGSDIAGTVEEIGQGVTYFAKGDRVTGFADVLSSNSKNGAFQ